MEITSIQVWGLLIAGVLIVLGGLVVFSDRFLSRMNKTLWKSTKSSKSIFPGNGEYIYNRYGRGLGTLVGGLIILIFALLAIFRL